MPYDNPRPTYKIHGTRPSEHRPGSRPPPKPPLIIRPIPAPLALGEVLGVRWGVMQGWEVVAASTVQPPVTYIWGTALTEAPPGTINVDAASPTIIGAIMEPPDGPGTFVRNYTGGVGSWVAAAGSAYIWDIGLTENPVGTISLDPAQAAVIGGVSVVARSATQGLELAASGALTGPLATAALAGTIVEPTADGDYIRRAAAGVFTWEAATTGGLLWGIGLTEDTTTTPSTINLDIANTNGEIGGVMTVPRTNIQGLDMGVDGTITVPPSTDLLLGGILEPTPSDTTLFARKRTVAGVSTWEPVTAGAFVGDDPPPGPNTQGQFWYESNSGRLFIYYDDGVGAPQWVQVGGP